MRPIYLEDHRPEDFVYTSPAPLSSGQIIPFGQTNLDVVRNIIDAFHAIGEAHLLDPFNGGQVKSGEFMHTDESM